MHRLLERLDGAASTLVPLLYLAGLMAGTLAYFADVKMGFTLAVGVALACAAELHSFLQQRRVRALFALYMRARARVSQDNGAELEGIAPQFWTQAAILAGLVAFSMYNSVAFVAANWTPAPGWLPAPVQVGIRGAIIPGLFLLAGFLSPLTTDASAMLASAAHEMLHHTIKTTVKQWRARVKKARRRNLNLAPVAIALMLDAGDTDGARRVQMIDAGLAHAEAGRDPGEAFNLHALAAPTLAGVFSSGFTPTGSPTPTPLAPIELATPATQDDPTPDGGPSGPTGGPTGGPRGGAPRPSSAPRSPRAPSLRLVGEASATPRRDSGITRAEQEALWERDKGMAREILAAEPVMSTRELARRLSVGRVFTCHPGRAATIRRALDADAATQRAPDAHRARA